MTTSIASPEPWPAAAAGTAAALDSEIGARATLSGPDQAPRSIMGLLDDAAMALLIALLFPVVILLVGIPVALLVRLAMAIAPPW
jgi:hypothetical protein